MSTKHTPGPWSTDMEVRFGSIQIQGRAIRIASAHAPIADSRAAISEWHANTRLIAAAPDLLKVVDDADTMIATLMIGRDHGITPQAEACINELWPNLVAVLNKAKGKPAEEMNVPTTARDLFWRSMKTGMTCPCSQEMYDDMLDAVPPEYMKGNVFAMGEAYTHTAAGEAVHAFFWKSPDGECWARYLTLNTRKPIKQTQLATY